MDDSGKITEDKEEAEKDTDEIIEDGEVDEKFLDD